MELAVATNAIEIARWLQRDVTDQIPFATATTLNRVADRIRSGERKVMSRVFDRPTNYTLNSFRVTPARKTKLQSIAGFREWAPKGTPANKYLGPQVFGGPRRHNRFESLMAARGIIPKGSYLIPAPGIDLDTHGNVKRSYYVRILSAFGAHREMGSQANRTNSRRSQRNAARFQVFMGSPGGEQLGIWQRVHTAFGDGVKPLFWVQQREPRYRKRFAFFEVAENIHKAHYEREFRIAMQEAIVTAKPAG